MAGFDIEFLGERIEPRHTSGYIRRKDVEFTADPYKVIARKEILFEGKKLFNAQDTIEIFPENVFYEIQLRQNKQVAATLYPRVQINPSMGGILPSPDISRGLSRDLYTHVSSSMNRETEATWGEMEEVRVKIGQQFFVNDYVAVLEKVAPIKTIKGFDLNDTDIAVQATIRIEGEHDTYFAEPIFVIRDQKEVGRFAFEVSDLAVKITLMNIHPDTQEFTLGLNRRQKDWVIIKAMEKPLINVLWLGTGLLTIGFLIALRRRLKEA
jgi:cytochrome c-type biogenesis protein CcmF